MKSVVGDAWLTSGQSVAPHGRHRFAVIAATPSNGVDIRSGAELSEEYEGTGMTSDVKNATRTDQLQASRSSRARDAQEQIIVPPGSPFKIARAAQFLDCIATTGRGYADGRALHLPSSPHASSRRRWGMRCRLPQIATRWELPYLSERPLPSSSALGAADTTNRD
jgi:hypothetical protein